MDRGSIADLFRCNSNGLQTSPLFRELSPRRNNKQVVLPEHTIASIAYQMLWGLGYLHFESVLHRDIKASTTFFLLVHVKSSVSLLLLTLFTCLYEQKPANVLISSSGKVKLADFGIVSQKEVSDSEKSWQMNSTVIGTTRYMSPERLRGKPYTMSSDVWSLGLVLLECLRGDSPFEDVSSVVS